MAEGAKGEEKGGSGRWLVAVAFHLFNSYITRLPSYALRHFYLRQILGIRLGKGAAVHMGCFLTGRHIAIGDRSVINRDCRLDGRVGIRIGADVSISPEVYILSLSHDPNSPDFATLGRPVEIGARAWIGARAMLLPGAILGEGAVAGAGAVVTGSVAPFTIVAGVPARKIGERNRDLRYSLGYFPYFNTDILPE